LTEGQPEWFARRELPPRNGYRSPAHREDFEEVGGVLLKPGTRLKSSVDTTEVVVVRAPADAVELRCGGQPMGPIGGDAGAGGDLDPAHSQGTQLGKRYADAGIGLEVLCTKGGEGSLAVGDDPLLLKDAKPLPSSD
jgi:hypothetical protein